MAFPTIDGRDMMQLEFAAADPGTEAEVISRPGIDSVLIRVGGKKRGALQAVGIRESATTGDAETDRALFVAMQGTLVTIVLDTGITYTNVMVLTVEMLNEPRKIVTAVGGSTGAAQPYHTTFGFALQLTEVT